MSVRPAVIISAMRTRLGFGMTARRDPVRADLEGIAGRLGALGFDELWSNDGRLGSGLATLAAAAGGPGGLDLGVGVVALSERGPGSIAEEVVRLAVPLDRLILGVGTGSSSSLALVRAGVASLRDLLPSVRVAISALGPRMCFLGGEIADLVLLNWAFPERIAWARERIAAGAVAARRPVPRVAAYVRVAIGPGAVERLATEADRYRDRPRPYARLFDEQEVARRGAPGIAAGDPARVPELLAPYRDALDTCIVRALPIGDAPNDWLAVAEAATLRL